MTASERIRSVRDTADVEITNHGSIFLFTPLTQAGREFVAQAEEGAQYWGLSLVVEHRYANDVASLALDQGLHLV